MKDKCGKMCFLWVLFFFIVSSISTAEFGGIITEKINGIPNPFNSAGERNIIIRYLLSHKGKVRIEVKDVDDHLINVIVYENQDAGLHLVNWNGKDQNGVGAPSDVYCISLVVDGKVTSKFFVLKNIGSPGEILIKTSKSSDLGLHKIPCLDSGGSYLGELSLIILHSVPQSSGTITTQGGTVKVNNQESDINNAAITVPVGGVSTQTVVAIGEVINPPCFPETVVPVGSAIEFGPVGLSFEKEVIVILPYTQRQLEDAGIYDPQSLRVYGYDITTEKWGEISGQLIDTKFGLVSAKISVLAFYCLGAPKH